MRMPTSPGSGSSAAEGAAAGFVGGNCPDGVATAAPAVPGEVQGGGFPAAAASGLIGTAADGTTGSVACSAGGTAGGGLLPPPRKPLARPPRKFPALGRKEATLGM